jgi:homopolymeric O-antigen transport system ATP-binding protein
MAHITAKNVSLLYPITGAKLNKMVGMPKPESLVTVRKKQYLTALDRLSFNFHQGDRIGLIGRNGSGKSTLLKVLGGIFAPSGGQITISGKVSSLFNINLGVQPDASGRDNIMIRGLVKGWSRQHIREQMDEIIAFSELEDFIEFPMRTYSDGMRMRLLFAIATSFSPEILLLDEWIGAGDAQFQKKAAKKMNSLVDKAGIVVMASHNPGLIRKVCTKAIWLDGGHIRAYDDVDKVYDLMAGG